jgi:hypothetical protein
MYPKDPPGGGEGKGTTDHTGIYKPAKRTRDGGWTPGGRGGPGGPGAVTKQPFPGEGPCE